MMQSRGRRRISIIETSLLGVIAIGLLHGLEPGHGWPIALLYSVRTGRPAFYAFVSSGVISLFHFVSSITVVLIYFVAGSFVDFTSPVLKYVAFGVLIVLAGKLFLEKMEDQLENQHGHFHDNSQNLEHAHEHQHPGLDFHTHLHFHPKRLALSLRKIASCAFFLVFAHEEEFALLALAMGGVSPLLLMSTYGTSVTASLVGITLLGTTMYGQIRAKIYRYEKYIPKISGAILVIMAILIITT
jgi:ABC-type nickel/cobalt efflux system permease component RcnA